MEHDPPKPIDWLEAVCDRAGVTPDKLCTYMFNINLFEEDAESNREMTETILNLFKGFENLINSRLGEALMDYVMHQNKDCRAHLQKSLRNISKRAHLSKIEQADQIQSGQLDAMVKMAFASLASEGAQPTNSELTDRANRIKQVGVFVSRADEKIEIGINSGKPAKKPDYNDFTPISKESVRQSVKRQGLQNRIIAGSRGNPAFGKSGQSNSKKV